MYIYIYIYIYNYYIIYIITDKNSVIIYDYIVESKYGGSKIGNIAPDQSRI